ncbi:MAG: hypothetical protein PHU40_07810 [Sulfurimonas sp.]|nr:hypothetical protein [Sulfurimonas sp.]
MSVNLRDVRVLLLIEQGETVKRSSFGKSFIKTLDEMIEIGSLMEVKVTRNSFNISMGNQDAFTNYLANYLFIDNLRNYILALTADGLSRSELSELGINTKLKSVNPKSGLHMDSPDNISVKINGEEVKLGFPKGCALFVHKENHITFDEDILIVGVENFENISGKLKDRTIFPDKKILFIERSKSLRHLLSKISNDYLHFGDIDLAGIFIYQTEYEPIVGTRGSFFIPNNIESLLKRKGIKDLSKTHDEKYQTLIGNTPSIASLIETVKCIGRTLEQEYFLK